MLSIVSNNMSHTVQGVSFLNSKLDEQAKPQRSTVNFRLLVPIVEKQKPKLTSQMQAILKHHRVQPI